MDLRVAVAGGGIDPPTKNHGDMLGGGGREQGVEETAEEELGAQGGSQAIKGHL